VPTLFCLEQIERYLLMITLQNQIEQDEKAPAYDVLTKLDKTRWIWWCGVLRRRQEGKERRARFARYFQRQPCDLCTGCAIVYRVGQNHTSTVYTVYMVFLAENSPNIRSYTMRIYSSDQP